MKLKKHLITGVSLSATASAQDTTATLKMSSITPIVAAITPTSSGQIGVNPVSVDTTSMRWIHSLEPPPATITTDGTTTTVPMPWQVVTSTATPTATSEPEDKEHHFNLIVAPTGTSQLESIISAAKSQCGVPRRAAKREAPLSCAQRVFEEALEQGENWLKDIGTETERQIEKMTHNSLRVGEKALLTFGDLHHAFQVAKKGSIIVVVLLAIMVECDGSAGGDCALKFAVPRQGSQTQPTSTNSGASTTKDMIPSTYVPSIEEPLNPPGESDIELERMHILADLRVNWSRYMKMFPGHAGSLVCQNSETYAPQRASDGHPNVQNKIEEWCEAMDGKFVFAPGTKGIKTRYQDYGVWDDTAAFWLSVNYEANPPTECGDKYEIEKDVCIDTLTKAMVQCDPNSGAARGAALNTPCIYYNITIAKNHLPEHPPWGPQPIKLGEMRCYPPVANVLRGGIDASLHDDLPTNWLKTFCSNSGTPWWQFKPFSDPNTSFKDKYAIGSELTRVDDPPDGCNGFYPGAWTDPCTNTLAKIRDECPESGGMYRDYCGVWSLHLCKGKAGAGSGPDQYINCNSGDITYFGLKLGDPGSLGGQGGRPVFGHTNHSRTDG